MKIGNLLGGVSSVSYRFHLSSTHPLILQSSVKSDKGGLLQNYQWSRDWDWKVGLIGWSLRWGGCCLDLICCGFQNPGNQGGASDGSLNFWRERRTHPISKHSANTRANIPVMILLFIIHWHGVTGPKGMQELKNSQLWTG
jgi:hypothetical protein